jgi:hypothetical protein
MATKYGPRKKHNAGTKRTSYSTKTGRTRSTVTTKTGNYTRSRSVNKNGTVRQTTTHKSPSGFWTRTTKTIGSKPSKPKAPKFIKVNPFKAPKLPKMKSASVKTRSSGSNRKSRSYSGGSSDGDPGFFLSLLLWPIEALFTVIGWVFGLIIWCIKWSIILGSIYLLFKWLL